jgi:hypothetical protein
MIIQKITREEMLMERYVSFIDFEDIMNNMECDDPFYVASIVACMESVVQLDKEFMTFINMFSIKYNSNYKFYSLYELIKNNSKLYNYIVKYFNLWHMGKHEVFSFDEYSKSDLLSNYYELASLVMEEREYARISNDKEIYDFYNLLCGYIDELQ